MISMPSPSTIAIDGPAASGKSTVGKQLADRLGYLFFDTGLMYRAVTWAGLNRCIDLRDEGTVAQLAERVQIDVQPPSKNDGRICDLLVDGLDVTWEIRSPQVDANVSVVAAYPGVRAAMTVQQRRIGLRGHVVMVGRDIGTVVLPEADLKVYLDASVEERARRRWEEQRSRGESADHGTILASMRRRDEIDSTRSVAPLRPADDAVILNSDQLDATQVLDKLIELTS